MHLFNLAIVLSLYSASYAFPAAPVYNTTMAVPTMPVDSSAVSKKHANSTSFKEWFKKHKKALLLGTATAATLTAHNYGAFNPVYDALPKNLRDRKFVEI